MIAPRPLGPQGRTTARNRDARTAQLRAEIAAGIKRPLAPKQGTGW